MTNKLENFLSLEQSRIASTLYDAAHIAKPDFSRLRVKVINPDTGSIRSSQIEAHERTRAVSSCAFYDSDGVYVELILFIHGRNNFGELYIWKVNDTPVEKMPSVEELVDFCKM